MMKIGTAKLGNILSGQTSIGALVKLPLTNAGKAPDTRTEVPTATTKSTIPAT